MKTSREILVTNAEHWPVQKYMESDRQHMTPEARDFLDEWSIGMEAALHAWREEYLPSDFPFDFSFNSLDALEGIVLERYGSPNDVDSAENAEFTEGAVRYIGEVVVRNVPSRWGYQDLGDGSPGIYNKIPVVRANVQHAFLDGFAPIFELRFLADERQSGLLRSCHSPIVNALEEAQKARGTRSHTPPTRDQRSTAMKGRTQWD
jgi:hypothetical protein